MPTGFWKVYAKWMAVLFGMVAFAADAVIGLAGAAYGITKAVEAPGAAAKEDPR